MSAAAANDIFLYWGSGSAPCWQVMIVLEEKQLSGYGNKLISFKDKEHKSAEILKVNPRGQVPTFKHGEIVLNESKGICHYLENQFKNQGTKLIPCDPCHQASVLQCMYEAQNLMDKSGRNLMYYLMRTPKEKIDEKYLEDKRKELAEEVEIWENYLKHEYLCGSDFTMADVFFFPLVAFLVRGGICLEKRPNLKKYYEKLSSRKSIDVSWPPHYRETPPTEIFKDI